jgi:Tfp pilus assembly protein PilN
MKAINLLPPDLRGAPKGGSRKAKAAAASDEPGGIAAFVALGVLAACVAAVAAYVLTTNTVKDRQAQLEAVTAEAATTTQRVSQLTPYADFQQMAETRIQTVKDLASSRFDWEQALRDISRAIPADVTLTAINGTIAGGSGATGSTVRTAIAAPAVELKGCTPTQKNVATLLSRLRNVDGVTRVSLSKSLKPAVTAQTGAPATSTTETVCPGGRPPSFELVMFFERSTVPSSVDDITVSTGTGNAAANGSTAPETTKTTSTTQPASGVTTPPADPAASGTATPASTPQGGDAK